MDLLIPNPAPRLSRPISGALPRYQPFSLFANPAVSFQKEKSFVLLVVRQNSDLPSNQADEGAFDVT
jgi:hypothetical protein